MTLWTRGKTAPGAGNIIAKGTGACKASGKILGLPEKSPQKKVGRFGTDAESPAQKIRAGQLVQFFSLRIRLLLRSTTKAPRLWSREPEMAVTMPKADRKIITMLVQMDSARF